MHRRIPVSLLMVVVAVLQILQCVEVTASNNNKMGQTTSTNTKSPLFPTSKVDDARGQGYSQQYHYSAADHHEGVTAALSVDIAMGIFLAGGAIVLLLAFSAIIYPLLKKGGHGQGWRRSIDSKDGSSDLASNVGSVLTTIEKLYRVYSSSSSGSISKGP